MEIVYNNNVNKVTFDKLNKGDVFQYNSVLFMKTRAFRVDNTTYNAVRLIDGYYDDFTDEYVTPVKGKFVMD